MLLYSIFWQRNVYDYLIIVTTLFCGKADLAVTNVELYFPMPLWEAKMAATPRRLGNQGYVVVCWLELSDRGGDFCSSLHLPTYPWVALFAASNIARDDGWPNAGDPLGQVGEDEDITGERSHAHLRRNTTENARVISSRFRTE